MAVRNLQLKLNQNVPKTRIILLKIRMSHGENLKNMYLHQKRKPTMSLTTITYVSRKITIFCIRSLQTIFKYVENYYFCGINEKLFMKEEHHVSFYDS